MSDFTIFDYVFNDEELEEEFENYFVRNDLQSLFTNEHRSSPIRVSWTEARGLVNGTYSKDLLQMQEILAIGIDNKMYESAVFRIIYNSRSMQGLVNRIRKINSYYLNDINEEHEFNTWNIVWYHKELA